MGLWPKDELQIIVFRSYGTNGHLYVRGRALEDENIDLSQKGFFPLLRNTWKRFETDEIRNAPIVLRLPDGRDIEGVTDSQGYFLVDEAPEGLTELTNDEGWLSMEVAYGRSGKDLGIRNDNRFEGEMLIPHPKADYGVISDIDDTIMHTGVTSLLKWKVIINTFFRNASTRIPLEGASELYRLLHRGRSGRNSNPIFYVSHSPWNLYRYLVLFLRTNHFPKGPILLRSMSSFRRRGRTNGKPHKQKEIANILKTYPELSFILIGDGGEQDPDIYMELAERFPSQVSAIYIHAINQGKRMRKLQERLANFKKTPALLVNRSTDVIAHARAHGFLP